MENKILSGLSDKQKREETIRKKPSSKCRKGAKAPVWLQGPAELKQQRKKARQEAKILQGCMYLVPTNRFSQRSV